VPYRFRCVAHRKAPRSARLVGEWRGIQTGCASIPTLTPRWNGCSRASRLPRLDAMGVVRAKHRAVAGVFPRNRGIRTATPAPRGRGTDWTWPAARIRGRRRRIGRAGRRADERRAPPVPGPTRSGAQNIPGVGRGLLAGGYLDRDGHASRGRDLRPYCDRSAHRS
jgi:hypothetical protein